MSSKLARVECVCFGRGSESAVSIPLIETGKQKKIAHFIHDSMVRGWIIRSSVQCGCGFGKWDTTNELPFTDERAYYTTINKCVNLSVRDRKKALQLKT